MALSPSQAIQAQTTSDDDSYTLPPDMLFVALLRLPARELCRLRAVCRSWRSLTSDRLFIDTHAAKHPGPLLLARFEDDEDIHVMDLSTRKVVKRIANPDGYQLVSTCLDLCLLTERNKCRVLNPATGASFALPEESQAARRVDRERPRNLRSPYTSFAFGKITATSEYKVLRMFSWLKSGMYVHQEQLFEIFTINGGGAGNAELRVMKSPDDILVDTDSAVIIDGVVYFLRNIKYDHDMKAWGLSTPGVTPDCIASFDMESEQWRDRLQGPVCPSLSVDDYEEVKEYCGEWHKLITISELKGSLALAFNDHFQFIMDIWFLTDFQNGLWVKKYSIPTESITPGLAFDYYLIKPVLVLKDGRLVILLSTTGTLLIFDPMAIPSGEVLEMRDLDSVALYTGSLLSLPDAGMV